MLERVKELHKAMRDLALRAKISEKKYDSILHAIGKKPVEYVQELLVWMEKLYDNEHLALYQVFNKPHITPQMWDNYKLLGIRNLPEQLEFEKAATDFRAAFRLKPRVKKDEKDNVTTAPESST